MLEAVRTLVALFVDDALLAAGTLAVVGVAAVLADLAGLGPAIVEAALLGGCLAVLALGVLRAARTRSRTR